MKLSGLLFLSVVTLPVYVLVLCMHVAKVQNIKKPAVIERYAIC